MAYFALSTIQQRIYDKMVTQTAYSFTELLGLAKEFSADSALETTGSIIYPPECIMTEVDGLCAAGYVTPAVPEGYDEDDLDDWTFTVVDSPSTPTLPLATPAWVIPWTIQGDLQPGTAPA